MGLQLILAIIDINVKLYNRQVNKKLITIIKNLRKVFLFPLLKQVSQKTLLVYWDA